MTFGAHTLASCRSGLSLSQSIHGKGKISEPGRHPYLPMRDGFFCTTAEISAEGNVPSQKQRIFPTASVRLFWILRTQPKSLPACPNHSLCQKRSGRKSAE